MPTASTRDALTAQELVKERPGMVGVVLELTNMGQVGDFLASNMGCSWDNQAKHGGLSNE